MGVDIELHPGVLAVDLIILVRPAGLVQRLVEDPDDFPLDKGAAPTFLRVEARLHAKLPGVVHDHLRADVFRIEVGHFKDAPPRTADGLAPVQKPRFEGVAQLGHHGVVILLGAETR